MIDANKPLRILVAEDNDTHARLLENAVTDILAPDISLARADTLAKAVKHVVDHETNVVLLDLSLPDSTGLDTLRTFRDKAPHLPVVALIGADDEWTGQEILGLGALDYLPKERITPDLLARSLVYAVDRHRLSVQMERICLTDPMTGILNRNGFLDLAGKQLAMAERENRRTFMICVDVNNLRGVNADFGHEMGDKALVQTVGLLQNTFRGADVVGRLSGDEFAVFGMEQSPTEYGQILQRLERAVAELNAAKILPFPLGLTSSLAYNHPENHKTLPELLYEAETILREKME